MDVYSARTLCVYKLVFNQRRKPDNILDIHDLDGSSVIKHFSNFANSPNSRSTNTGDSVRVYRLKSTGEEDDEYILANIESGIAGENRVVFDTESELDVSKMTPSQAALVATRVLLTTKGTGNEYALLCVEHASGAGGDTVSISAFKNYLGSAAPNVVMKHEPVMEKEALDAFTSIEQVAIKYYLKQGDIADSLIKESDYITLSYNHKRNRPFSLSLLENIKTLKDRRNTLVGLKGSIVDNDASIVEVKMKDNTGKTKNFLIDDTFSMKVSELLNSQGNGPLSNAEFKKACFDKCEDISSRLGRIV